MSVLSNKVALVTGGSRGIGAAIAARLARDGAAVALTYAASAAKAGQVVQSIQAEGGNAVAIEADSADPEAVKRAVAETAERLGRLDILVNNAGVIHLAPIDDFPDDEFERMLAINVRGVFAATKAAARLMSEGGRIIIVGSVNSDSVPFSGASVYALTKGAVASFARGLARDLGPRGITVNNIQPGPIDTDMNPADGQFASTLRGHLAIQRYGSAEEIAGLVAYLAGPEGGYITGANLKIDGGFTA
jgi:3-oxoacyl-[acyl-carrier protein] reductase